jgi:predicted O-linked N-acetylglucosamine transferase (SPINDLY family)
MHITCYSDGAKNADTIAARLRELAGAWRDTAGLSDEQLAAQVRADRIDILFDLTMHMDGSRLLALARRPAPVQATYLAYCSTTGLETMDYRLSDPWLDAPGDDESVYSERTIRLRHNYWCYEPPAIAPGIVTPPLQKTGFITFGCLNNFCKVTAPVLGCWRKLLSRLPKSRLILHAGHGAHRQRVIDFFGEEGIAADRIEFVSRLPFDEYLVLHNHIDIALDPFPCNGGTTTCDAAWMGVPVVTRIGRTAVGRGGVNVMNNLGLQDLVATSDDAYIQIASTLASDEPRLASLRRDMRQRMLSSALMNGPQFARGMEHSCRQMWQRGIL